MQIGFFYWPFGVDLTLRLARAAERYGYDLIGGGRYARQYHGPGGSASR